MKINAIVQIYPNKEQSQAIKNTIEKANNACNLISQSAWDNRIFGQYSLHKLVYSQVREYTKLTAQVVVRCIAKVSDAYKLDKETVRTFKPYGAIAYDDRILRWYTDKRIVSIWTVNGRQKISFKCGIRQAYFLTFRHGETDLIYHDNKFFLSATCDIPNPTEQDVEDIIGVDMGIVNIATDSDGNIYSGEEVENNRKRIGKLRSKLQSKGTKSAKRKLKKLSGKQKRFQKNTNHVISKRIVVTAQCTNRAIAIEKLTGINSRTKVRGKEQRARHSNWSFYQLKQFIAYKAKLSGIPLIEIDPRYTSQRCFICGHVEKANRKSQSKFHCRSCGHENLADVNAAKNISWAAKVNQPIVSTAIANALVSSGTSRLL